MAVKSVDTKDTPDAQLKSFIERFDPKVQTLSRTIRAALRKRLPTNNEFAYDYGTHIVIAYSPTDRSTDGIVSTSWRDDGVRLYFTQGVKLPDPKKLLEGSATRVRYVRVESAKQLAHPDIEAFIAETIKRSPVAVPSEGGGTLVIKPTTASKRAAKKSAK